MNDYNRNFNLKSQFPNNKDGIFNQIKTYNHYNDLSDNKALNTVDHSKDSNFNQAISSNNTSEKGFYHYNIHPPLESNPHSLASFQKLPENQTLNNDNDVIGSHNYTRNFESPSVNSFVNSQKMNNFNSQVSDQEQTFQNYTGFHNVNNNYDRNHISARHVKNVIQENNNQYDLNQRRNQQIHLNKQYQINNQQYCQGGINQFQFQYTPNQLSNPNNQSQNQINQSLQFQQKQYQNCSQNNQVIEPPQLRVQSQMPLHSQVQSQLQSQMRSQIQSQMRSHSQPQIQSLSYSQSQIQSLPPSQMSANSQSQKQYPQSQIQSNSQSQMQSHSQLLSKPQLQSQMQVRSHSQSQIQFQTHSQSINEPRSTLMKNVNITIEKIVWDYLHFQYNQNPVLLGYLAPYIDNTFNMGKFQCLVTSFCQRQRISKDTLIIYSKNWFRENIEKKEQTNIQLTISEEIYKYIKLKLNFYSKLGFNIDNKIVEYYHNLIFYIIRNIWKRLEEASFERVDWSSRSYLTNELDNNCNYDLIAHLMKMNNNKDDLKNSQESNRSNKVSEDNEEDIKVRNETLTNEEEENSEEQIKEMILVSRTQKWLLRNVKLIDFKYLISMDDLYDKFSNKNQNKILRLPKKTRNLLLSHINRLQFNAQ